MLALGDKLVAELELSADVDTLARWMAHYLAELLVTVRSNDPALRDKANAEVSKTILELWKHREHLPEKSYPFRDFKPVCQVLHSLDLDTSFPRFFTYNDDSSTKEKLDSSSDSYLNAIRAIDKSARLLIQFVIQLATEKEAKSGREWLETTGLAGVPDDDGTIAIRFIVAGRDVPRTHDGAAEKLKRIDRALAALKLFDKVSPVLADELRALRDVSSSKSQRPKKAKVAKAAEAVKSRANNPKH
jgi:hypothetical protein